MTPIGSSLREDWPTAVVVGAGGLGMAVARRLGLSHRLLIADRDASHVEKQCAALRSDGFDAVAVPCDVTRKADIAALAATAASRPAMLTLAHVVGLSPAAQDYHTIMAVNLVGAAMVAEAFVDVLHPGGAGVFISSSAAHMQDAPEAILPLLDAPLEPRFIPALAAILADKADPNYAYSYSKIGLMRMCRRLAASWGRKGLRIISLSPGLIATPQGAESYKHSPSKVKLFEAVPLGRECSMLEISGVVAFLASDQASYITGTDILQDDPETNRRKFIFLKGPIFANVILADEINRTPPKTQAALLEAMQERRVTLDGEAHSLPAHFMVVATQNPVEHEGTFPLPESQLDRFLIKINVAYPPAQGSQSYGPERFAMGLEDGPDGLAVPELLVGPTGQEGCHVGILVGRGQKEIAQVADRVVLDVVHIAQ